MLETVDFRTIDDFMSHWAVTRGDNVAMEQDDRFITYAQLEERSRQIAGMYKALGLAKGDRIAWLGKNSDLYFQLFLSAARIGVVMVPIGWRLAPAEIEYILRDTGAKVVFAGEGFESIGGQVCEKLGRKLVSETAARTTIVKTESIPIVPAGPLDAALQLYTSGTTGHPKGVVLGQCNLFGLRKSALQSGLPWTIWEEDEVILVCMPVAHIGGTGLGLGVFAAGVRAIIQVEFESGRALDAIAQGVTRFFLVPAALQMVIQHPRAKEVDFSRLKFVMYGSAPIPLELLRQAVETMPNAGFIQCYGMTETTGTVAMLPPWEHDIGGSPRMRSAGKAVPGVEIRILDSEGRELPPGQVGEVVTRSNANMLYYWQLSEATAKTLTSDGWIHTGDAAYIDEDGYIFIQDRIKDMIISGGENVYPAEVESAIYGHPDIAEVAVIGIPDAKWGEAVKACVVGKPGHVVDPDSVIQWARERIAAFKVPKSVDVIEELPRNATGKILRRSLREPYWSGFDRQVN